MVSKMLTIFLYYFLGVVPPSLAGLHACCTHSQKELRYWLRYLLAFSTMEYVILPSVDPILSFLPMSSWMIIKLALLVSILVPKSGVLDRTFLYVEANGEKYGNTIISIIRTNVTDPLMYKVAEATKSMQNTQPPTTSRSQQR